MSRAALRTPFAEQVGIEVPLICGAMYPCSNPELVAAASEAGAIGVVQPISLTYVHGHDFRLQVRRNGERQSQVHAARVVLHRSVDEALHLGECHDLVELAGDLLAAHAQDAAVEIDVFAARQFRMKAGADFQK